jgi:hypothetical protein
MANIPEKPKKQKRHTKTELPPIKNEVKIKNLEKKSPADLEPLAFKVDPEFKKAYKIYATEHGKKMVDILKESFELYREKHPSF